MAQFALKSVTAAANTAFLTLVPPSGGGIPCIRTMLYTSGGTAHTITVMKPVGDTLALHSSEAGLSVLTLKSVDFGKLTDGSDHLLASGDYLIWQNKHGGFDYDTVSSVSGSVVTLTSALSYDVVADAPVWTCLHLTHPVHPTFSPPVSETTPIPGPIQAGYKNHMGISTQRSGAGDPLLIYSDNPTAAGTLVCAVGDYCPVSNPTTT